MKKWIVGAGLLFVATCLQAQNAEEWTQQKRTQLKYLRKQIEALQVYIEFAQKGYHIAQKGLTLIGDIKDGDFKLHRDFIGALKLVNPKIRNLQKVADIIAMQLGMVRDARVTIANITQSGQYTTKELGHTKNVFNNVFEESLHNLERLIMVITAGELEMRDDERIKEIDRIYVDMQASMVFSADFSQESMLLSLQRKGEAREINRSTIINGLP